MIRGRWFVLPVHGGKVFLQVSSVNVGLAELQLSSRVVVNVVDTHFVHDAKTSLKRQRDSDGDGEEDISHKEQMWVEGRKYGDGG